MAEGFAPADYITNLRLSELQSKRLWLVRVPRHIDPARLEGVKVKLPVRKGREGKVLGRVTKADDKDTDTDNSDHERGDGEGGGLVLKAADPAESHGFRALFSTEEDGALGAAPPFAGQVNVAVETANLEPIGLDADTRVAGLVEPYRGRPQLKGMRVRSKPAGAGSEYTRTRPLANRDAKKNDAPPATPVQASKKMKPADGSGEARVKSMGSPVAETPTSSKKKKKRKSTGGGGGTAVGLEQQGSSASSATKKSKKKKTALAT